MNLVPIDAAAAPPELSGGDASTGGDFAALMTGLMSGDTQIVPLLDLPIGNQLTSEIELKEGSPMTDDVASPLDFIGTLPSGLMMNAPTADTVRTKLVVVTEATAEQTEDDVESAPIAPAQGESITTPAADEAAVVASAAMGLATIHPISRQAGTAAATEVAVSQTTTSAPGGPAPRNLDAGEVGPTLSDDGLASETAPVRERTSRHESIQATPAPTNAGTPAAPTSPVPDTDDGLASRSTGVAPAADTVSERSAAAEPEQPRLDVELDTGHATRPTETGRPAATISQPAMVGIARRVEEAIAALATKPDPKIVTLQLDELDGLRLTVALRPDGLHLSSSGDAALTSEIERALASRGFDMASNGDRSGQAREERAEDDWRPQPAPPGRPNRTNPSGIRL